MATAKRKPTEMDFDLAAIRKAKRLMNRAVKEIETYEKLLKRRRADMRETWREKKRVTRERANADGTRERQDASGVWHNLDLGMPPTK